VLPVSLRHPHHPVQECRNATLRPRRERCRTIFRRCRSGKWRECHKDRLPLIMPGRPIRSSGTALDSPVATWSLLMAPGTHHPTCSAKHDEPPATRRLLLVERVSRSGGEPGEPVLKTPRSALSIARSTDTYFGVYQTLSCFLR
jgi:hypothetical protein